LITDWRPITCVLFTHDDRTRSAGHTNRRLPDDAAPRSVGAAAAAAHHPADARAHRALDIDELFAEIKKHCAVDYPAMMSPVWLVN
jgi:hypothetical protein